MKVFKLLWPAFLPAIVGILFTLKYQTFLSEFPNYYLPDKTQFDGYADYFMFFHVALATSLVILAVLIYQLKGLSKSQKMMGVIGNILVGLMTYFFAFH